MVGDLKYFREIIGKNIRPGSRKDWYFYNYINLLTR